MEDSQRVLSEFPAEDIAIALATLQRERAGPSPEPLLRSLRSDSALYDKPPLSQKTRRIWTASNGGASHRTEVYRSRPLSELPAEDVPIALAALQRETAGLPPEPLLRSLRSDGALYDKLPLSQHIRRIWTSSNGGASHRMKGYRSGVQMPPQKLTFHDAGRLAAEAGGHLRASERCSERPSASIGRAKGMLPCFVEAEAGSQAGGEKGPHSVPSEQGKPPASVSSYTASRTEAPVSVSSCMTSRTEAMVQALSQKEKDRLLRQFLSPPRKLSGRGRRGEAGAGGSNNGNDLRLEESEVLDVQAGLLRSLQDQAETAVRDDLDDKAVKLGLRASQLEYRKLRCNPCEEALEEECVRLVVEASKREFLEMLRRDEEEEIECNALVEKAKLASLLSSESCSPFLLRRESGNCASSPEDGTRASH